MFHLRRVHGDSQLHGDVHALVGQGASEWLQRAPRLSLEGQMRFQGLSGLGKRAAWTDA